MARLAFAAHVLEASSAATLLRPIQIKSRANHTYEW